MSRSTQVNHNSTALTLLILLFFMALTALAVFTMASVPQTMAVSLGEQVARLAL